MAHIKVGTSDQSSSGAQVDGGFSMEQLKTCIFTGNIGN